MLHVGSWQRAECMLCGAELLHAGDAGVALVEGTLSKKANQLECAVAVVAVWAGKRVLEWRW